MTAGGLNSGQAYITCTPPLSPSFSLSLVFPLILGEIVRSWLFFGDGALCVGLRFLRWDVYSRSVVGVLDGAKRSLEF